MMGSGVSDSRRLEEGGYDVKQTDAWSLGYTMNDEI